MSVRFPSRLRNGGVMGSKALVLEQPAAVSTHDSNEITKERSYAWGSTPVERAIASQDRRAGQIREWLLLILRFAVTRDSNDEAGVFGKADELNSLGLQWRPSAPSFFRRTSAEICNAITVTDDPKRAVILKRHLARIDDLRLRRAFEAAVELRGKVTASVQDQAAKLVGEPAALSVRAGAPIGGAIVKLPKSANHPTAGRSRDPGRASRATSGPGPRM